MNKSSVTVVIGGNTYTLRAGDAQGLRDMPAADRDQLIGLLEALKAQHDRSRHMAQAALMRSAGAAAAPTAVAAARGVPPGERLGKSDIDAIMVRLAAEERQQRKSGLKPATIYKFAAVVIVIIVLLSVF